ncbi:MAG: phosphoglycerate dehydrogenase [Gemmatimonadetes bacterium]|nr:phosphoglycerate dehydrogenase [Gemmatimonadota bacterium]
MASTYRILVTDAVDPEGVAVLTAVPGFRVDEVPTLGTVDLLSRIADYDAIVGRSATRISAELLRAATRLRVVGRAGVGVDNVDMDAATALGVAVINAPAGNTVAVAELLFGSLIGLVRGIPAANLSLHEGRWERSRLMGRELKGRSLGIVGLGRIGSEVAVRAHAFGMEVGAFDPYVTDDRFLALRVRRYATLEALLDAAELLTVHTPLTDETRGMIGARELGRLRSDAVVANLARGGIVDEGALVEALRAGRLAGATLDAFVAEPLTGDHPLRGVPNLLLTPHIGASTQEAQRNVAVDVCEAVRDALLDNELSRSLNVATGDGVAWREVQPVLQLVQRAAVVARAMLAERGARAVTRLALRSGAEWRGRGAVLLSAAAVGALESVLEEGRLNLINARTLAAARGMQLSAIEGAAGLGPYEVEVALGTATDEVPVAGSAPPGGTARLTRIGGFHVDVNPRQTLVILTNRDVPGVIGRVGTLLGNEGVNIAEYHQARLAQGGEALAAVSVDGVVTERTRQALLAIPDVLTAAVVRFGAS